MNPDEEAKPAAPEAAPSTETEKSKVELPSAVAEPKKPPVNQKNQRLIDWNCELLLQNLRKVVARRETEKKRTSVAAGRRGVVEVLEQKMCNPGNALSEVEEVICLPKYEATKDAVDPKQIDLGDDVASQMRDYIAILASLYRENSFHCFEHASE